MCVIKIHIGKTWYGILKWCISPGGISFLQSDCHVKSVDSVGGQIFVTL